MEEKKEASLFSNILNLVLRRKKFLVYPEFQIRFIGYIMGVAFTVALIFLLINIYFYYQSLNMAKTLGMNMEIDFLHFLVRQNLLITIGAIVGACLSALVVAFAGLFLSHRLVGPLIRFRNVMNAYIEEGKTEHLEFRKDDFFKEFAELYNKLVNKKGH